MVTRALTFPGQGSQFVGMGKDLAEAYPAARAVFEEVDEALGESLFALMIEGPDDALRLTENAQPALMAHSMAVIRVLEDKGLAVPQIASHVAGHSLGEYSALCAAGTLSIAATARLLRIRGKSMQQAVPLGEGRMAAILGLELEEVATIATIARQGEVCEIANDNAPGQVVISGDAAAVKRAMDLSMARGAKRAIELSVSAPFHCSLMAPAAEAMEGALATAELFAPSVPVVANVVARPIDDPEDIRHLLVEQVTSRVRWRQSILWMAGAGEVSSLVEIGAGKVLTGVARRIVPGIEALTVGKPDEIEAFAAAVAGA
jgi:[acyl-carrier-protein] S-malonyltransferase